MQVAGSFTEFDMYYEAILRLVKEAGSVNIY